MMIRRIIPDTLTCCNLLCGAAAVFAATQNWYTLALLLMIGGALFDFFDGMSARALHAPSPIGVELDSLADDITFGLAPAMALFCYLRPMIGWWCLLALLMAVFSALRLAKFNIDERQKTSFIGLATPANALFWGGITCMPYAFLTWSGMPWLLLALSLVSCYLLVSEIPFFSMKFHNLTWKDNYIVYLFLIGCIVLIATCIIESVRYGQPSFAWFSGTMCIVWYVLYNLLTLSLRKKA